jgi:hypothetical protein
VGFSRAEENRKSQKIRIRFCEAFPYFFFLLLCPFIGLPKQIKMAIKKEEVMQILGTQIAFEFKGRVMRSPDNPR